MGSRREYEAGLEYTDYLVMLGPNLRWVQQDFEDLYRQFPEALIGYHVLMASPRTLDSTVLGRRVAKFIVVGADEFSIDRHANARILASLVGAYKPRVEVWNLNPSRGPVGRL